MFIWSPGPPFSGAMKDWSTSPAATTLASTASRVLVLQSSGMLQVAWLTVSVPAVVLSLSCYQLPGQCVTLGPGGSLKCENGTTRILVRSAAIRNARLLTSVRIAISIGGNGPLNILLNRAKIAVLHSETTAIEPRVVGNR